MTTVLIALRLIHIVLGAAWFGFVVFTTVFLTPAIGDAGPAGGAVMGALQRRGIMTWMPMFAIGTLLSGVALYWLVSDNFSPAYVHSPIGMTFAIGGVLAIAAYVVGITVMRPSMLRAMALAQAAGGSPSPSDQQEIARLRARGAAASTAVLVLMTVAVASMAVARYL